MYLRPFRRGKSHFKEVKKGNKRKEFYDSTVRTNDYMRKKCYESGDKPSNSIKDALLRKDSKLRGMKCV